MQEQNCLGNIDMTAPLPHSLPMAKVVRRNRRGALLAGAKSVDPRPVPNHYKPKKPIALKQWMDKLGATQSEIAVATGISQPHLSLIANGERQVTQQMLEILADFLGIEPAMLFHPPGEKPIALLMHRLTPDERRMVARMIEALKLSRP